VGLILDTCILIDSERRGFRATEEKLLVDQYPSNSSRATLKLALARQAV
jgi:hypothetical protein